MRFPLRSAPQKNLHMARFRRQHDQIELSRSNTDQCLDYDLGFLEQLTKDQRTVSHLDQLHCAGHAASTKRLCCHYRVSLILHLPSFTVCAVRSSLKGVIRISGNNEQNQPSDSNLAGEAPQPSRGGQSCCKIFQTIKDPPAWDGFSRWRFRAAPIAISISAVGAEDLTFCE